MNDRIEKLASTLTSVAADARATFAPLSSGQLNWKPVEKSWSIAQCFDHLITTHSLYFPLFEKLAEGPVRMTWWENYSPLSGFFGRRLIKSLDPENRKPMKTTAKGHPSASEIGSDIVQRFEAHQTELIDHLKKLPEDIDLGRIITSPMLSFVTYTLDDTFTILDYHCRRHFDQAKRVTETVGFPRNGG